MEYNENWKSSNIGLIKKLLVLLYYLILNGAKQRLDVAHNQNLLIQEKLVASNIALKLSFNSVLIGPLLKSVWKKSNYILELLTVDNDYYSSKQQQELIKQQSS